MTPQSTTPSPYFTAARKNFQKYDRTTTKTHRSFETFNTKRFSSGVQIGPKIDLWLPRKL